VTSLGVVSYCQAHAEADACLGIIQQGWLPLACVMLFLPGFYLGMAGVVFVLISEMIPLQVKKLLNCFADRFKLISRTSFVVNE
jgi:hypothetical protein